MILSWSYVSGIGAGVSAICVLYLFVTIETTLDCQEYEDSWTEVCNKANDKINQKIKEASKLRSFAFFLFVGSYGTGIIGTIQMYRDFKKWKY